MHTVVGECRHKRRGIGQELDKGFKVWLDNKVAKAERDLWLIVLVAIHVGRDGQMLSLLDVTLTEKFLDYQIRPPLAYSPGFDGVRNVGGVKQAVAKVLSLLRGKIMGGVSLQTAT